nr:hypothetical protein CFP56_30907 [Quercus suber]
MYLLGGCGCGVSGESDISRLPANALPYDHTYNTGSSYLLLISRPAVPTFVETSNVQLNEILATFRNKHFIPAALPKATRRLIFEQKSRQSLQENPRTITLGDEEVELRWLDRTKDIPSKKGLLTKVLSLLQESADDETWRQNIPALLKGLYAMNPHHELHNQVARAMVRAGQMGTLIVCLQQAKDTGMSLRHAGVLDVVMWGLHSEASQVQWSEESLATARRHASLLAMALENDVHTPEKGVVVKHDHRSKPWVIGTFLELEAAWALKFQDGQDVNGKVKTYTERLLDCLDDNGAVSPLDQTSIQNRDGTNADHRKSPNPPLSPRDLNTVFCIMSPFGTVSGLHSVSSDPLFPKPNASSKFYGNTSSRSRS